MTHLTLWSPAEEEKVGREYTQHRHWLAKYDEKDERDFIAFVSDGEEAGYRITHKGCGGWVTLYGDCLNCGKNIYW